MGGGVYVLGQESETEFNKVSKRPAEIQHNFDMYSKGAQNCFCSPVFKGLILCNVYFAVSSCLLL